jgi:hypothetical protein
LRGRQVIHYGRPLTGRADLRDASSHSSRIRADRGDHLRTLPDGGIRASLTAFGDIQVAIRTELEPTRIIQSGGKNADRPSRLAGFTRLSQYGAALKRGGHHHQKYKNQAGSPEDQTQARIQLFTHILLSFGWIIIQILITITFPKNVISEPVFDITTFFRFGYREIKQSNA